MQARFAVLAQGLDELTEGPPVDRRSGFDVQIADRDAGFKGNLGQFQKGVTGLAHFVLAFRSLSICDPSGSYTEGMA